MTVTAPVGAGIGRIVLNHPPLNILTRALLADLRSDLARLAADSSLRVLLLSAEGKHFSAGADVGEHLPPTHLSLIPEFLDTVAALDRFPLPVVAAVQGRCLGGGFELVQAADLVVAGESAQFGQPEIGLGVIPPAACALLPRRVSRASAAQTVFTGDLIGAADAHRMGLVARVVPDGELECAALELAGRIARHSGAALRLAKRALRAAADGRPDLALGAAGDIYLSEVMRTADALEGLQAFMARRPAVWRDA